jgi:hypothetical protein
MIKYSVMTIAIAACVLAVATRFTRAEGSTPCTPADFALSKLRTRTESSFARLTGVVRNNCAGSAGPQLKWTAYYSDGTIAFSDEFWPASTVNIPPHTDYALDMLHPAPLGKWTYKIEVINVQQW